LSNWKLGAILDGSHEEGVHAWYRGLLLLHLGVKVFKNTNINKAIDEYLITKYLEQSGLTTIVHAVGWAYIRSPRSGKVLYRPVIWMEHVEGPTARGVLDDIIYNHCPRNIIRENADIKTEWAYASSQFEAVRFQLERAVAILEHQYGVKCLDHYMNMNNFILQANGLVKVIDFSKDNRYSNGIKCPSRIMQEIKGMIICSHLPSNLEDDIKRLVLP
jgi:hypothetical protein